MAQYENKIKLLLTWQAYFCIFELQEAISWIIWVAHKITKTLKQAIN